MRLMIGVKPRGGDDESHRWVAYTVLAVALLVRTLYLLSIRHAYFFEHLVTEPARYDAWAMDIVRGVAPMHPPFDEGPAYPYFVALVYSVAGHNRFAVTALQALLDAGSCAAVAALAMRISKGTRLGWTAGMLAAFFGPTIYFTGQLEPASLAVFAVSMAIFATPTEESVPARGWLIAGAAWAIALLVRSEILIGLVVVLLHAWLVGKRVALARVAIAPAALLATTLAINVASSGHPVLLTTGSGVNLWIGNSELADGTNPFVEGPLLDTAREIESKTSDAVVADAMFRDRAFRTMRARLFVRKFLWLWTDRELPNAMDIEWQEKKSFVFALPFFPLRFGVLFALACAGIVASRARFRSLAVLFAPLAIATFVSVVFFTNARFRLVLAPSFVLFAALAIDAAWTKPKAMIAPAIAAALAALLSFGDWDGVREHRLAAIDQNTQILENAAKIHR